MSYLKQGSRENHPSLKLLLCLLYRFKLVAVNMMTQVVCSVRQSIGSVYKTMSAEIGVSKTAVYDKLNRLEPNVSKALVKSTAIDLATIIHQLGGEQPELLPGYRVKILALQWSGSHRASSFSAAQHALPDPFQENP